MGSLLILFEARRGMALILDLFQEGLQFSHLVWMLGGQIVTLADVFLEIEELDRLIVIGRVVVARFPFFVAT